MVFNQVNIITHHPHEPQQFSLIDLERLEQLQYIFAGIFCYLTTFYRNTQIYSYFLFYSLRRVWGVCDDVLVVCLTYNVCACDFTVLINFNCIERGTNTHLYINNYELCFPIVLLLLATITRIR